MSRENRRPWTQLRKGNSEICQGNSVMKFAKTFSAILAIFLIYATVTEGMSLARSVSELRCRCINIVMPEKPIKNMKSLELIPSGPHCKNTEVIITLKSGSSVCVDPSTPWVEKIIKNILEKQNNEETV